MNETEIRWAPIPLSPFLPTIEAQQRQIDDLVLIPAPILYPERYDPWEVFEAMLKYQRKWGRRHESDG